MKKVKSSTLQERFGFADEDLKTTKHDDIMLWVDINIVDIIEKSDFHREIINRWCRGIDKFGIEVYNTFQNDIYKIENYKKIWEYPISNEGKNMLVIGFIDMKLECKMKLPDYDVKKILFGRDVDLNYYIEVKTEIKSLGELFRQIQLYKSYKNGNYIIVSPDDKYKKIIEEQGLYFIKYE
jgi:hypothetical protein